MLKSGLVSITFRNKTVSEICALCEKACLSAIEWGGDIHVPPKGKKAKETLAITRDHGLSVSSYGSYFRLGEGTDAFQYNLYEALNLESPIIRIWGGKKDSKDFTEDERKYAVGELMKVSEIAHQAGVRVALEYHPFSLTDDRESVKRLLKETEGEPFSPMFYWQPRWDWGEEESIKALTDVKSRLSHVHIFKWEHTPDAIIRKPLEEGESLIKRAIDIKRDGYMLIEFVKDDLGEMLLRDAETLNRIISGRDKNV